MTFHQLLHELGTNPAMAKSFVAQLCQEGYILGMNTVDDVMALPQADLTDIAVHMFPSTDLSSICANLKKRHANQERQLSYTYGNFIAINREPARFTALGMRVFDLRAK